MIHSSIKQKANWFLVKEYNNYSFLYISTKSSNQIKIAEYNSKMLLWIDNLSDNLSDLINHMDEKKKEPCHICRSEKIVKSVPYSKASFSELQDPSDLFWMNHTNNSGFIFLCKECNTQLNLRWKQFIEENKQFLLAHNI